MQEVYGLERESPMRLETLLFGESVETGLKPVVSVTQS